tara:strand:- start:554 stop:1231 length:678 start_codon:yes stop_codon:yes gene_type:complete
MKNTGFKQIDLLRKRREDTYLLQPYFVDTKKYLKKGIYIGLTLISISIIVGLSFIIRTNILEKKKSNIKNFVDEYDSLQLKLNNESQQLKNIASFNDNLKNAILNISSSSALLKEISNIVPRNIKLVDFENDKSFLILKGEIYGDQPLELANAFLLSLNNSEFINFDEIDFSDIKINEDKDAKTFTLNVKTNITNDYKFINKKYLKKLGSNGLANRIDLLQAISE